LKQELKTRVSSIEVLLSLSIMKKALFSTFITVIFFAQFSIGQTQTDSAKLRTDINAIRSGTSLHKNEGIDTTKFQGYQGTGVGDTAKKIDATPPSPTSPTPNNPNPHDPTPTPVDTHPPIDPDKPTNPTPLGPVSPVTTKPAKD
jgi:hypothetical protein